MPPKVCIPGPTIGWLSLPQGLSESRKLNPGTLSLLHRWMLDSSLSWPTHMVVTTSQRNWDNSKCEAEMETILQWQKELNSGSRMLGKCLGLRMADSVVAHHHMTLPAQKVASYPHSLLQLFPSSAPGEGTVLTVGFSGGLFPQGMPVLFPTSKGKFCPRPCQEVGNWWTSWQKPRKRYFT